MSPAAEVTIFSSMGTLSGLTDLAAAYERATGNKVVVAARVGPALPKALNSKEPGDLVANFSQTFDDLVKRNTVVAGSVVEVMRAGVGVAVKKGAPKPDISTPEAFKQAMLKAKSIGYSKSGSGIIAEKAMHTLGIFDQVKDRVRYLEGTPVAEHIAKGEVEIGMQQINAIIPVAGAEYVGPLPGDLQEFIYFSVGVLAIAKDPDAVRAFVKYMASPAAAEPLRKSGMEPAR